MWFQRYKFCHVYQRHFVKSGLKIDRYFFHTAAPMYDAVAYAVKILRKFSSHDFEKFFKFELRRNDSENVIFSMFRSFDNFFFEDRKCSKRHF